MTSTRVTTTRNGSLITGNCEVCNEPIKAAKDRGQFNRNRGMHLRAAHGIKGKSAYVPKRLRQPEPQPGPAPIPTKVRDCYLNLCPHCGTKFYMSVPEGL